MENEQTFLNEFTTINFIESFPLESKKPEKEKQNSFSFNFSNLKSELEGFESLIDKTETDKKQENIWDFTDFDNKNNNESWFDNFNRENYKGEREEKILEKKKEKIPEKHEKPQEKPSNSQENNHHKLFKIPEDNNSRGN